MNCILIQELQVQHRLVDLIAPNSKVPSLILLILKGLEETALYKVGMEALLNQGCPVYENGPVMTPYVRLIELAKMTRVGILYSEPTCE